MIIQNMGLGIGTYEKMEIKLYLNLCQMSRISCVTKNVKPEKGHSKLLNNIFGDL